MKNHDLTDEQFIRPLLPPPKRCGRPRADDRRVLNGILYVLRTGIPWNALPQRYGDDSTCHRRLAAWEANGTWDRIWQAFLTTLDEQGQLEWAQAFLVAASSRPKRGRCGGLRTAGQRESAAPDRGWGGTALGVRADWSAGA